MFSTIDQAFFILTISYSVTGNLVPLYRYFGYSTNGYHLYTIHKDEIGTTTPGAIGRHGYTFEFVQCQVFHPSSSRRSNTIPLYRYVHTKTGQNFYTNKWQDIGTYVRDVIVGSWRSIGIEAYVYSSFQQGTVPFYRYNHSITAQPFYTTSMCEIGTVYPGLIGRYGYRYDGIVGYVVPAEWSSANIAVCEQ
ncbi:unnamed protein product [Rotaria magnacalcarata]|uniref:DUF5648 domain-containing protein n=1 Tax=Rotaria magnacalcarata TaxID=392030 RepID=A0A816T088_9BILA|nr:unnamed protein product [Rotaria magnacalcarata]CAF2090234.1 unnamed protein product [Rotaria magnacalcarata]CAF3896700.1 unnamed protein product [Rotaria magnacalcarata]